MGKTRRESGLWERAVMFLLASSAILVVVSLLLDFYFQTSIAQDYVPEFLAVLVGAFLALSLENWISSAKEEKYADSMKDLIAVELERMRDAAEAAKGNPLETQVWDALLQTGTASHLELGLRYRLFELYFHVHAFNLETVRERDATIVSRTDPSSAEKAILARTLRERNRAKEKRIIEMIDSLLASRYLKTRNIRFELWGLVKNDIGLAG